PEKSCLPLARSCTGERARRIALLPLSCHNSFRAQLVRPLGAAASAPSGCQDWPEAAAQRRSGDLYPRIWEPLMSEQEIRPGLADVPVAKSAISFIDGQRARLEYRGIPAEILARESTFEETCWLLLKGDLPTQKELADFDDQLRHRRRIKYKLKDLMKCLPETGHPMDALQAGVAAMGMFYPSRDVANKQRNWESVVRLIAKLPTVVAAFHRMRFGDEPITPRDDLDHAANFYFMLFEREPSPAVARVLDACLILHAEHSMNASTFSARVTASTLADPYTVISAAIGTLTGPLHGGANEEVLEMLEQIG